MYSTATGRRSNPLRYRIGFATCSRSDRIRCDTHCSIRGVSTAEYGCTLEILLHIYTHHLVPFHFRIQQRSEEKKQPSHPITKHQNVDLPEAWQLLQGQTKRYVQVSRGLKWLMKYDHNKFISLYLMTWNDSFMFIAGLTEFQSKTLQLK